MNSRTIAWLIGATIGALLLVEAVRAFGQAPAGQSFTLRWDDPNPAGAVAGYRIYRRDGTNWVAMADASTNEWAITLAPGLHQLAVTARGVGGLESARSAPLDLAVVVAVINLRVSQP